MSQTSRVIRAYEGGEPIQMRCERCGRTGPVRVRGGRFVCAGGCRRPEAKKAAKAA